MTAPELPNRDELARMIKDAYYHARDNGGTMHTAADDAADAILASDWLMTRDARVTADALERAAEAFDDLQAPENSLPQRVAAMQDPALWVQQRADRIRREAGIGGGGPDE